MRRIVGFIFCFLIICSKCFAEAVDLNIEVEPMTMDKAIEYALSHNTSIIDLDKTAKDQKESYDDSRDDYRRWQNKVKDGGYSFENETEYLTCWGHMIEIAKLQYDSFLSSQKSVRMQVEYSIKNMIYSMFELEDTIEMMEKNILKQESDVKIAEVKLSLNMITDTDLDSEKSELESLKLQLESARNSLETLKISLKQVMGYDISKELKLIRPEYNVEELSIIDVDQVIADSLTTNISAISSKIQYKQKENQYILATQTGFMLKDDRKKAKDDYKDAEFRLNNDINAVKENLKILYTQVKDKENEVKIAKENLDSTTTQVEQARIMYEIGMISKNAMDGYEISLLSAQNSYKSKEKEAILLKDRFNIAIAVGDIIGK